MCGRFVLTTPADALAKEFAAMSGGLVLTPRYNIAPMQNVVVVRSVEGRRTLAMVRWGLIPGWAKDPAIASRLINARAETAADKPSFREALKKRRCILPASGFYEWRREGTRRQPWYFRPKSGPVPDTAAGRPDPLLAIAAVWEQWRDPEDGLVETCCLLTTGADAVVAPVHDRMPLILDGEGVERWLDPSCSDAADLADLLVPAPEARLTGHPVSTVVNSVRNDDARCIDEEAPPQGQLF